MLNNPLRYTDPDGLVARAVGNYAVNEIYAANNLINETIIFPALDILSLPDKAIDWATNTTPDERMAWAASNPLPADDIGLGIVAALGKLPKIARSITSSNNLLPNSRELKLLSYEGRNLSAPLKIPEGINFEGPVYRSGSWKIHSGNIKSPHRYSSEGRGALYTSIEAKTVASELKTYGVNLSDMNIKGQHVSIENVLDLTNPSVRNQLGVQTHQLTSEDKFIPQAIGDWARSTGYNGIIAPSARKTNGRNLVIFKGIE